MTIEPDKNNKILVCHFCSKQYIRDKNKNGTKYCSKKCSDAANLERLRQKNKEKILKKSDPYVVRMATNLINRMQESGNTFNGVYIDYWNLGTIPEPTRKRVLARDDFQCQICSNLNDLHIHHIIPRKYGGDHSESNLITLCASCHRHIETGDIEHAIRLCSKNRERYHYLVEPTKKEKDEVLWNSLYVLNNINKELKDKFPNEIDLLTRMDSLISNLEEIV